MFLMLLSYTYLTPLLVLASPLVPIPLLEPVPLWNRFRIQLFWSTSNLDSDSSKNWNHTTLNPNGSSCNVPLHTIDLKSSSLYPAAGLHCGGHCPLFPRQIHLHIGMEMRQENGRANERRPRQQNINDGATERTTRATHGSTAV